MDALRGISSMATRPVLAELCEAWREREGGAVGFESVGGVDAVKRVEAGEPFDVVVLAAGAIDRLVAAGHAVAGSGVDVARCEVAIAVPRGTEPPAIDSEEALRRTVLATRRIGYSTGPSGVALLRLLERWGIASVVRARLVQAPPGVSVGTLLARGDADLGFQQASELMHVEGVDVIGRMPAGARIVTTFRGAVCAASKQREAAAGLLAFPASPGAVEAKRRHGMAPAGPGDAF